MDVSAPHRAVVAGVDGDVLVLLAGRNVPLTGRQIAAALGQRSHDGVRKSLERLVEQGIVDRQPAGNALMHALNRAHVGAAAVLALASMRSEVWRRLREAISAWDPQAAHVSVFGSAARGDGTTGSDIDLLVVRPVGVAFDDDRWRDQLDRLESDVLAWTGNLASVVEQSEDEMRDLIRGKGGHPLLRDLRRDGIEIAGTPLRKLLAIAG